MDRTTLLLLTAASTLLATNAHAWQQAGVVTRAGGRATTIRTRCPQPNCAPIDSATRAAQEQLFYRIDSLRWHYENRRLSTAERERVAGEFHRTVVALQELIDRTMQVEVVAAQPSAVARRAPAAASGSGFAYTVTTECRTAGYLGVTFDGVNQEDCRDNEKIIRFFTYPRIALVARSSPAERAGILEGDTLLALAGTDVTQSEISLTKLLVPDARFVMRVRREGEAKELNVTVREAPAYYVMRSTPFPPRAPMPGAGGRVSVSVSPAPPAPPAAAAPRMRWSGDGLAGAHVETLSAGLGRAVGAKGGVLVISASPGSPAYRSGLRDGDVIQRAAGRAVVTVRGLSGVLSTGDGVEGVKLTIIRERKTREVTLRW